MVVCWCGMSKWRLAFSLLRQAQDDGRTQIVWGTSHHTLPKLIAINFVKKK